MRKVVVIVTGIREIDAKLRLLDGRVQRKVASSAMRKGLKVVAAEVKAQAPEHSGELKRNIKLRVVKGQRGKAPQLEVRIRTSPKLIVRPKGGGKPVFYPAVVEYKRNQFMHRAYMAKGEAARLITIEALRRGVDDEVRRL